MKKAILAFTFLFCALITKAQLFIDASLHPEVTSITGRYFNGSGGKGYWTFRKIDSLGRTIERNSFKKKILLEKTLYQYNNKNDITYTIIAQDINRPQTIDTTKYEYKYINDRIKFQKCLFANNDSTIYKLLNNEGDSVFTYQYISYHYLADKKVNNSFEQTYILTYQRNLLKKIELINNDESKKITYFEYYKNGKLKRRKIERIPESSDKIVYAGGPGSDDMYFSYKYDKLGRVRKYYTSIGNKKYKLAVYRYE